MLLTRPGRASDGLARLLAGLGGQVDVRPTVRLSPPQDPTAALEALARLQDFDWVVFTSRNGVRYFQQLRELHPIAGKLAMPQAVAIGPDTAAAMDAAGIAVERIAEQPSSEGLLATLRPLLRSGSQVLWVRPELARPLLGQALRALGVELTECRCYRSLATPEAPAIAADYISGRYDVAVFASPSAFLYLVEADSRVADAASTRVVALGPVTAAAIARSGGRVSAIAQGTGDEALCVAVLALFE